MARMTKAVKMAPVATKTARKAAPKAVAKAAPKSIAKTKKVAPKSKTKAVASVKRSGSARRKSAKK
jgi:hypothetical protein